MTLEVSRQCCEKYTQIIFRENAFRVSRVVPRRRTDRQTDI